MRHSKKNQMIEIMRTLGFTSPLSREQLLVAAQATGLTVVPLWATDPLRRVARGLFRCPELENAAPDAAPTPTPTTDDASAIDPCDSSIARMSLTTQSNEIVIPQISNTFVEWGHFKEISKIIESRKFAPIFVTGLSGNGKTTMIEQICARQQRAMYRVNITELTDEDDLLGGMRLVEGNTVWRDGVVVRAMETGAILLLDEVDLGSFKIMCLQPVLEGKGIYLKKSNRWITPKLGFTVVATANTKGQGSDDGRFVGTNVLNEAFLDRFDFAYEQEYAPRATERKILMKKMEVYGRVDADFCDHLTRWSETIRKAFSEGAVTEIISTRRLEAIAKLYSIVDDRLNAIRRALSRFDGETQDAFLNFYTKIDANVAPPATEPPPENSQTQAEDFADAT